MTETMSLADQDMIPSSDEDDFVSSASTASVEHQAQPIETKQNVVLSTVSTKSSSSLSSSNTATPTAMPFRNRRIEDGESSSSSRVEETKRLELLDLPMDVLKEIIKEVTHTNDLTSLALTCSAFHALAVPHMYSRFDIVWPDTLSSSDNHSGVDALSYGLATLVMGEDIFREVPRSYHRSSRFGPCSRCGCDDDHGANLQLSGAGAVQRDRRGNYYAQYTRKFSVGNGPLVWVQEYSVTKETGKMLGTLVALAVARMVNLESFIWDMPTGVLRDVWIALASLADRPGHECRLERVWVRWHDNSENAMRAEAAAAAAAAAAASSSSTVPVAGTNGSGSATSGNATSLLHKYGHVEYPSLSILPPLKSLTVLDIDEPSYLDEMAVLIDRSRGRLKELRIGIALKVYQADWLKPVGNWESPADTDSNMYTGWPRIGGVLGILLSRHGDKDPAPCESSCGAVENAAMQAEVEADGPTVGGQPATEETPNSNATDNKQAVPSVQLSGDISSEDRASEPENTTVAEYTPTAEAAEQQTPAEGQEGKSTSQPSNKTLKKSRRTISESTNRPVYQQLKLETLELERVHLCVPFSFAVIDWTRLTTLTILRCENHEKLWRSLRRHYTPAPSKIMDGRHGGKNGDGQTPSPVEYLLNIKNLHTDAVSPYLLLFIKDTIAPNTLESIFLQEGPSYDSIVNVDAIYRTVIRKHRLSLRKVLIDSTERTPAGNDIPTTRWRKWMFTREMISFVTSGRMPHLHELGMAIHSKDWHFFLQRLPYIPQLRALYIPHIGHPIHRDPGELTLQILDIITIRPEVGLGYVGIQSKCYEILEGQRDHKSDDEVDADDNHNGVFPSGGDGFAGSDVNDDEADDEDGDGSVMDPIAESSSSDGDDSTDEDDAESGLGRSKVVFRLREILFYDDKISIFKARHGVL